MIIIKPLITEKTTQLANHGVFSFVVDPKAQKHQIKEAVESHFGVNVVSIHTARLSARKQRSRRTGQYMKMKLSKKAMVTLKDKQTIDLFEVKK